MEIRDDRRYTSEHEWLLVAGAEGTIGITDFAQDELGDVVYVAMPKLGARLVRGQAFGEIESVKTVSELFAPVSGEVTATNDRIADEPELVNHSPYEDGWMVRIRLDDLAEAASLLDADAYHATLPAGS